MCKNNTAEGRNSGAHSLLSGSCLLAKMIHLNCFRELVELLCSRFVAESWNAEGNKRAEGILKQVQMHGFTPYIPRLHKAGHLRADAQNGTSYHLLSVM